MGLSSTLAAMEEVGLDIVKNGEPSTAGRVGDDLAVGTGRTFIDDGT